MTIPEKLKISLACLFCGALLEAKEDASYSSGDLVECSKCKELNDYDSLLEVAKEKGVKQLSKAVEKHIKNELKSIFK